MTDSTGDLFADLDGPRPLPPSLRDRLEEQLLAGAGEPKAVPLGEELDARLAGTLTDPVAAAMAGIDAPRPLPTELRGTLSRRLLARRRRAQAVLGAAAAVVVAAALAVVVVQPGRSHRHELPAPVAAAPLSSPSAVASARAPGAVAGVDSQTTGSGTAGVAALPGPFALSDGAHGGSRLRSASPDAGPVAGGTTVTLRGRHLGTTVAVFFGGRRVPSYQVLSDSAVRAVSPAAAGPGAVDIVVRLASGARYRLAAGFTYR